MDEPLARAIYKDEDHLIRSYAINWPKLPADMVAEMLNDPNDYIRERAAVHRNISREVFESLSVNDSNVIIRRKIAERTIDIEKLKVLATDSDHNVRFYAAINNHVDNNLTEEVYKIMIDDTNVNIRSIIAMRSKDAETLSILAKDVQDDIRYYVAKNVNCSIETLTNLTSDSSHKVFAAADKTLYDLYEDKKSKNESTLRKYIRSILY